jgi:predicted TIM-barrel fold metal-dependent hydrolase
VLLAGGSGWLRWRQCCADKLLPGAFPGPVVAYTAQRYPPELVAYLRGHGRRKVLFGSDYPMITPERCLQSLPDLGLDDETRELFLTGNAQRILTGRRSRTMASVANHSDH